MSGRGKTPETERMKWNKGELNGNDDWIAQRTHEDEASMKHEQHDLATRGWISLGEHNKQEKETKKDSLAENTTDDEQPRQHKHEQAEKDNATVHNAARFPKLKSEVTCTPAKSKNIIMANQSPTDVSSSLILFNEVEENLSSNNASKNPEVETKEMKCENISETKHAGKRRFKGIDRLAE